MCVLVCVCLWPCVGGIVERFHYMCVLVCVCVPLALCKWHCRVCVLVCVFLWPCVGGGEFGIGGHRHTGRAHCTDQRAHSERGHYSV